MKTENWNGHTIRFVEVSGEWWSVAKDVADALGFRDANVAVRRMPEKYKGTSFIRTLGGKQKVTVLNEKGLYRLIMRSNKPEAEQFQDWVFEVIKQLREASGLQGFQVFIQMDKEHQKETMTKLCNGLKHPVRINFIKANTVANKAVSSKHGYPKMVKKCDMTPSMLADRENILNDTVELMTLKDKYGLDISVSETIYKELI